MIRPETEAELAGVIRDARRPFRIQGGGTRSVGGTGSGPVAGDVLDMSGLSGVTFYDPGALTMVAQAGTPLAEIETVLAAEGQHLAFEPPDHRPLLGTTGEPTIGGVVAGNISGPRRVRAGACRDFMLGVRFVDGHGALIRNGGRVMKNVTGYDLVRLMTGSWGTLGVLTEVAFKVLPKPEAAACLKIYGLTEAQAVGAMSRALGSPYEVTGAAHVPADAGDDPVTFIRIEGFAHSVTRRTERLKTLLTDAGEIIVVTDPGQVRRQWRALGCAGRFHGDGGDVWRLSVPPSQAPGLVARMPEGTAVILDWGGGLIWASCRAGGDLRAHLGAFDGHAMLVRADDATRRALGTFQPEPPPLARISAGLRARFDPRGLLNPGITGGTEAME